MGYRPGKGDVLANLGLRYHHLKEDEGTRYYSQCTLELAQDIGISKIEAYAVTHLGHAQAGLDNLAEALQYRQG
jgi:hypothetical protein